YCADDTPTVTLPNACVAGAVSKAGPSPTPVSAAALSPPGMAETVNDALFDPLDFGAKCTETMHVPVGASGDVHVLAVTMNSPLSLPVRATVSLPLSTLPVLVIVNVASSLAVFTSCDPNALLGGVNVNDPLSTTVPDS